jgi:hypothetical protein
MFLTRGLIFRKIVVHTGMVYYGLHAAVTIHGFYKLSKYKMFELFNIPI